MQSTSLMQAGWWVVTWCATACATMPPAPAVEPMPIVVQRAAVDLRSMLGTTVSSLAVGSVLAGYLVDGPALLASDHIAEDGIDELGRFRAPADQAPAPRYVLRLLADLDLAEGILSRGVVVEAKSLETDHILFRGVLELDPADAAVLGVTSIRVAIKPAARGTYGREYRRELLFYKLARHLEAAGVIPMVERDVLWDPLLASAGVELVEDQLERLTVLDDAQGERVLHGTVQLWVEGYRPIIGYRPSTNRTLAKLANALAPEGAVDVTQDPMWQAISDMLVLDFLVSNSDRSQEAGTVRQRTGGQRLVMLDNGDALLEPETSELSERCRDRFERLRYFSPNVRDGLQALDEETLRALLLDASGEPLVQEKRVERVWRRVAEARRRIARLDQRAAPQRTVIFAQPSRAR